MLRRLSICLAFATCCFLNTWMALAEAGGSFFARYRPWHTVVAPVVCWEIAIALGILAAWEFCRRRSLLRVRAFHGAFLAASLVPLGISAAAILRIAPVPLVTVVRDPRFWPLALAASVAPVGISVLRPAAASRFLRGAFLCAIPVLAFLVIRGTVTILRYPEAAYEDGPLAAALDGTPQMRVVWIIFDELSQGIAFGARPASLDLPNFDRLRGESFYATAAAAPADATERSMPSLTIGETVVEAVPEGVNDLRLRIAGRPGAVLWSSLPNVFDAARGLGFNTALTGWFLPYGRILNRSLTRCDWTAGWMVPGIEERSTPLPLPAAMWDRARLQISVLPLAGHLPGVFPGRYAREEKARRFAYLVDGARQMAADPAMGLTLVHLPVPHPPAIYDRERGTIGTTGPDGYLDNVALADRTLGELRRAIEEAGLWDRTALVVSADHGWRTNLWRGDAEWTAEEEAASHGETMGVPFLVRLPGEAKPLCYDRPLPTVMTKALITAILEGRVTRLAQVAETLQR